MSPFLLGVTVFLGIVTAGTGVISILFSAGTLSLVSAQQFFETLIGERSSTRLEGYSLP